MLSPFPEAAGGGGVAEVESHLRGSDVVDRSGRRRKSLFCHPHPPLRLLMATYGCTTPSWIRWVAILASGGRLGNSSSRRHEMTCHHRSRAGRRRAAAAAGSTGTVRCPAPRGVPLLQHCDSGRGDTRRSLTRCANSAGSRARLSPTTGCSRTISNRICRGLPRTVARRPELIYAPPTPAAVAAKQATDTLPIVSGAVWDPVGSGS